MPMAHSLNSPAEQWDESALEKLKRSAEKEAASFNKIRPKITIDHEYIKKKQETAAKIMQEKDRYERREKFRKYLDLANSIPSAAPMLTKKILNEVQKDLIGISTPKGQNSFYEEIQKTFNQRESHLADALAYGRAGGMYSMREMNPSLHVFWDGWRTTTFELGQNGWKLAADQDAYGRRLQLVFSKDNIVMIGQPLEFDYMRYAQNPTMMDLKEVRIRPIALDKNITFQYMDKLNIYGLKSVKHIPEISNSEVTSFADLAIFQEKEEREVIIENKDVQSLMKEILKIQSEKQKELREKERLARRRDVYKAEKGEGLVETVHAKIITLDQVS